MGDDKNASGERRENLGENAHEKSNLEPASVAQFMRKYAQLPLEERLRIFKNTISEIRSGKDQTSANRER